MAIFLFFVFIACFLSFFFSADSIAYEKMVAQYSGSFVGKPEKDRWPVLLLFGGISYSALDILMHGTGGTSGRTDA